MAGRRKTPAPRGGEPGGAERRPGRPGYERVQLWLPAELAKKLRIVAADERRDYGEVVAPVLEREWSGVYLARRSGRPPETPAVRIARPAEPAGPSDAPGDEPAAAAG